VLGLLEDSEDIAWCLPLHIDVVHLGGRKVCFKGYKRGQKDMTKNEHERDGWPTQKNLNLRDWWLNKRE
jgi:hypothetical protein